MHNKRWTTSSFKSDQLLAVITQSSWWQIPTSELISWRSDADWNYKRDMRRNIICAPSTELQNPSLLLLQVWTTRLVLRTAAAEEGDGASLLSSLPPRPETSHGNSATVFALLHHTAMGAWGRGTSVSAAQTQSPTSSASPSVLPPARNPMSWRYAAHSGRQQLHPRDLP